VEFAVLVLKLCTLPFPRLYTYILKKPPSLPYPLNLRGVATHDADKAFMILRWPQRPECREVAKGQHSTSPSSVPRAGQKGKRNSNKMQASASFHVHAVI